MFRQKEEGVEISLYIQPGASKSEITGVHNDQLKIKIKAPPVDGKANEAVVAFLSEILGIPKRQIELYKGEKSREKKVFVRGISIEDIRMKLKI
jgi:uncharacterized protein